MIELSLKRKRNGVPILSKAEISGIAEAVIADYAPEILSKPQEVDIEAVICDEIGAFYDNHHWLSPGGGALGLTTFNDGLLPVINEKTHIAGEMEVKAYTVFVDSRLNRYRQIHRKRYTLAHECGHIVLHGDYYAVDDNNRNCYGSVPVNTAPYREERTYSTERRYCWPDEEWLEWQADTFASCILMPERTVRMLNDEITPDYQEHECLDGNRQGLLIARMIEVFDVSREAAVYRAMDLNLISENMKRYLME